jgi:hypothetical protein
MFNNIHIKNVNNVSFNVNGRSYTVMIYGAYICSWSCVVALWWLDIWAEISCQENVWQVACVCVIDNWTKTCIFCYDAPTNDVLYQIHFPFCKNTVKIEPVLSNGTNRGADKSLAQRTSRCILIDGQIISFDASLVIYINSTNIPPIIIINRIYEHQNLLSL